MNWLQLHIDTNPQTAEQYEAALMQTGAVSVTLQDNADQPVLEPGVGETPLWDAIQLTALFEDTISQQSIVDHLTETFGSKLPALQFESLEDQDWERRWLDDFKPMRFGQKLWICPSWHKAPEPYAINILLDPGLAFGTGTHQTTALCLEWLEQADLKNKTVIDYGCGSGILAIAALLLGAKSAICVDNDPQALVATLSNAEQNGISSERLSACLPQQLDKILHEQALATFDLVIANILAGPLVDLAPELITLANSNGKIVLSGILDVQASAVMDAYKEKLSFEPLAQRDEWIRLSGSLCKSST